MRSTYFRTVIKNTTTWNKWYFSSHYEINGIFHHTVKKMVLRDLKLLRNVALCWTNNHTSLQSVIVLLMVQFWIVMTLGIVFVNMDLMVVNVISVRRDLLAANVMSANRISLVMTVINANQLILIIHCVKVCRSNCLFEKSIW